MIKLNRLKKPLKRAQKLTRSILITKKTMLLSIGDPNRIPTKVGRLHLLLVTNTSFIGAKLVLIGINYKLICPKDGEKPITASTCSTISQTKELSMICGLMVCSRKSIMIRFPKTLRKLRQAIT